MGLITVLRDLWRVRLAVATLAVFALMVTTAIMFRVEFPFSFQNRHYEVGIASARALIDSPSSQAVDLGGKTGADIRTLAARANLLASLMTSSPIKDEIARRAHVPIELLVTPTPNSPGAAAANTSTNLSSAAVSENDPRAFILKSSVPTLESGEVPIIAVETQAPHASEAARLADQAIVVLRAHLDTLAGNESVPQRRRVTVRELGAARSAVEVKGPSPIVAILAGLFAFGLGCAILAGIAELIRSWRAASRADIAAAPERLRVAAPVERVADEA